FRIYGGSFGTGVFTATNSGNSANLLIDYGTFSVPDISIVGTGSLTLANEATLRYTGPSASSSKPITLDNDGRISTAQDGTNLTLTGIISGFGSLGIYVAGLTSTFPPTANNTYTGNTTISSATISVATIPNNGIAGPLGASNAFADIILNSGTLRYTGASA